ncbi:[histone H3]-lysine(4) N-trimethyltransferase [Malassezia sp. CBS 17886]|nr:[histone H3]-lysine(4) N-trimethyltransferase [Malassezia sp. CBS 17886]
MDFFGGKRPETRAHPPARAAVTTTTSRAAPASRTRALSAAPERHNALPAAVQSRIAQERAAVAAPPVRPAPRRASSATRAPKRARGGYSPQRRLAAERGDSTDSAGDSADESAAFSARLSRSTSLLSGSAFQYNVPRDIVDDSAYDPLPASVRAAGRTTRVSSSDLVKSSPAAYYPFFEGIAGDHVVSLTYPAADTTEDFPLLVPKDPDEYDPISDLLRAVGSMVAYYVPPAKQHLFGALDSLETGSNAGAVLAEARLSVARAQSASRTGTPQRDTGDCTSPGSAQSDDTQADSILRAFTKARNRRDGPLFVRTLQRFNAQMDTLRADGSLHAQLAAVGSSHGVPERVWRTVQEQVYARSAAPDVEKLKQYEAFSDAVYGEMLPPFLCEVLRVAQLGPQSVFVDLGCGIGNLLLQASLQAGCEAYGCEFMAVPAQLAKRQIVEATHRWRMWGLRGGPRVEAWCEDFTESDCVRAVLRRADLVVVNNYAFRPQTNDTLSLQFLDLKDGAKIVSLRPFVPHDFRLSERTLSSPLAILRVEERTYTSGCVSWAAGGGKYYVQTVDRSLVQSYLDRTVRMDAAGERQGKRTDRADAQPIEGKGRDGPRTGETGAGGA